MRKWTMALSLALTGMSSFAAELPLNQPPEGFSALFNGKDLTGFYGHATKNPETLWAMAPEALEAHKQKTHEELKAHWKVVEGILVNDGKGLYATTWKDYGDFELLLEYKTVPKADSGIYVRGCPQIQIWDPGDPASIKHGSDKGSGGLWNNSAGSPGKDPSKKMDRPFGEWNQFRVMMIGERISVWLNKENVVDDAIMENYFDRKRPVFPRGPIQLQTHGGEISWRNVFIREIGADEANSHLRARSGEGYRELFNGTDLQGWKGAVDNYEVVEGSIMCKKGKGGTLYHEDVFADFSMRFEFLLPPGGNNGIAVRYSGQGDPAWAAFELQILDDTHPKYANLKPYQVHGSIYGLLAAKTGYLRPVGEWNYQEIHFKGQHAKVILNGSTILNADLSKIDLSKVEKVPKGMERTEGHLGFAGHSDPVRFRQIAVKKP